MGDGTNLVLVLAGQLLHQGQVLLKMGLHPSEVISGFVAAANYATTILDGLTVGTAEITKEGLMDVVKTVVGAKQWGYEDMLGKVVCDAVMQIMPSNPGMLFFYELI
jgi:T-complex protein 1 subunit theta